MRSSKSPRIVDIEAMLGVDGSKQDTRYGLPRWYLTIRGKRLCELSDGDVARLIRQDMYLDFVVPEAVARLRRDPLAGEMYEGEIVRVLARVEADYWLQHPDQKELVRDFARGVEVTSVMSTRCIEAGADPAEITRSLDVLRAESPKPDTKID